MATRLTLDQKSPGSSPGEAAGKLKIENAVIRLMKTGINFAFNKIQARSSSGLGRRPLKAETTGSNPVRATKSEPVVRFLFI